MEFFPYLLKHIYNANLPVSLITSDKEANAIDLNNSLLLFHAPWSGQSIISIQKIFSILQKHNTSGLKAYILNIDTLQEQTIVNLLGELSHGYGEAVVYKKGILLARHTNSANLPTFLHSLTIL